MVLSVYYWTVTIWETKDPHLHIAVLFILQNVTARSTLTRENRCFIFTFHFHLSCLKIGLHIRNCQVYLKKCQRISMSYFTHEVVYGSPLCCFLETVCDSLFWKLTRSTGNAKEITAQGKSCDNLDSLWHLFYWKDRDQADSGLLSVRGLCLIGLDKHSDYHIHIPHSINSSIPSTNYHIGLLTSTQ